MNSDLAVSRPTVRPIIAELITARLLRGWTQKELAERLGVSASDVSRWERMTNVPTIVTLSRWADVLGYDLALIAREADEPALTPGSADE